MFGLTKKDAMHRVNNNHARSVEIGQPHKLGEPNTVGFEVVIFLRIDK